MGSDKLILKISFDNYNYDIDIFYSNNKPSKENIFFHEVNVPKPIYFLKNKKNFSIRKSLLRMVDPELIRSDVYRAGFCDSNPKPDLVRTLWQSNNKFYISSSKQELLDFIINQNIFPDAKYSERLLSINKQKLLPTVALKGIKIKVKNIDLDLKNVMNSKMIKVVPT